MRLITSLKLAQFHAALEAWDSLRDCVMWPIATGDQLPHVWSSPQVIIYTHCKRKSFPSVRATEPNRPKSLWQLHSGPKVLLTFLFLLKDLVHKFLLHIPLQNSYTSSCGSYWCYIKRCCSCWCCSCSHRHFSSSPTSISIFRLWQSAQVLLHQPGKKNHCQKFCKKSFSGFFLRAHFVDKLKRTTQNQAISPECTCCQSSEVFSFASLCLLKEGQTFLLSFKA